MHRRIVFILVIACQLMIVSGVPLYFPSITGNHNSLDGMPTERFPCENCGCGCDSAEHCWRDCCCHTLEERLAWARKNGVRPPSFVQEMMRSVAPNKDVACGCCQTPKSQVVVKAEPLNIGKTESVLKTGVDRIPRLCMEASPSTCCASQSLNKSSVASTTCGDCIAKPFKRHVTKGLLFIKAWQCRGLSWQLGITTPVIPPIASSLIPEVSSALFAIPLTPFSSLRLDLATPPPRANSFCS